MHSLIGSILFFPGLYSTSRKSQVFWSKSINQYKRLRCLKKFLTPFSIVQTSFIHCAANWRIGWYVTSKENAKSRGGVRTRALKEQKGHAKCNRQDSQQCATLSLDLYWVMVWPDACSTFWGIRIMLLRNIPRLGLLQIVSVISWDWQKKVGLSTFARAKTI